MNATEPCPNSSGNAKTKESHPN